MRKTNDMAQKMAQGLGRSQILQRTMSPQSRFAKDRKAAMNLQHEKWMRQAIDVARRNARAPFGTVLIDSQDDLPIVWGLNRSSKNPTLHGEIDAIHRYAESGRDRWSYLTLYTTAEPCCMCQAAILWAGIPTVVFGTTIQTLSQLGWNQFRLTAEDVCNAANFADCEIIGGVLEAECDSLFEAAKP